ncbi:choice-of-anchor J domain-containing protein [Tamlana flava]|uniref:choice-of-anchor J domain-containing protein n=1 Tax=Tamlana flava TaxID=3158572 RepID=UPI00351AE968
MKKITLTLAFVLCCYSIKLSSQCDNTLPVLETFDTNVINVCWDVEDSDGDSYSWQWWEFSSYYGGYKVIASYSFDELTPDNWVISHAIDLTSYSPGETITLSWKVRGELSYAAHEYYSVYAATSNDTSSFESTPIQRSEYTDEVGGAGVFVSRSLDISSLAGNTVYIAFRHHNTSNQSAINIDELSITTGTLGIESFDASSVKHYYDGHSDALTLKSSNAPIDTIDIFNILGKRVLSQRISKNNDILDLSSLSDDIYIANLKIGDNVHTIKFVKH